MAFFPGDFEGYASSVGWTRAEKIIVIVINYLIIATYGFLVLLALRNIWVIIVRLKEYKNLPILTFYIFAFLAVSLRMINLIWMWTEDPVVWNEDLVQQSAKLSVGIVQDWITLELAIRIHNQRVNSEISKARDRRLKLTGAVLFGTITVAFITFAIIIMISARKQGSNGVAFGDNECQVIDTIGWIFLG